MEVLLYAPVRPALDYSVGCLWLMAVGTVICASLWADITAPEQIDERYNELSPKVFPCNLMSILKFTICFQICFPFYVLFVLFDVIVT